MGCDIHTYVEFSDGTLAGKPFWKNFTRNGGSRNYVLFGVLAGVRCPDAQLFEPKGMPDDGMGFRTADDYWNHVAPEDHPEWADGDDWVTLAQAERWIESGYSVAERDADGRLRKVSGPDWHSHSWLTADELDQALQHYAAEVSKHWPADDGSIPAEWQAMLSAMRTFEANGSQTRIVFWFDN